MQKAVCDKCKKPFFISKTRKKFFKDDKQGTVIIHYFDCPYCKEKYPFLYESEEIKKLIKKQKKLRNKIHGLFEKSQLDKVYSEMDKLTERIKSIQDEYKLQFNLKK